MKNRAIELIEKARPLSLDNLIELKNWVDQQLSATIAEEKRQLHEKLEFLESTDPSSTGRSTHPLRGKTLPAKYVNPNDLQETWAGRGIKPRWLVAALESGHSINDFAVDPKGEARIRRTYAAKRRRAGRHQN